jgi:hypothetical protein
MDTTKENSESLIDPSKEVCLEINTEEISDTIL